MSIMHEMHRRITLPANFAVHKIATRRGGSVDQYYSALHCDPIRQHRQMFDLAPRDGEDIIARPGRLFAFVDVNDHERIVKLRLKSVALQLGDAAPLLLPYFPLDISS